MNTRVEGWWEGIVRDFGIDMYTLVYLKWITNKNLLYSTGNYIQYPLINHNGKEYEKVHTQLNHFAVHQKHNIVNQLYFNKN